MCIDAVIIDSREPDWVQTLTFEGAPKTVTTLDIGDVWVLSNGNTLLIERKTPEDFLNSLRDERLLVQLAKLTEQRNDEILYHNESKKWPYLIITGDFMRNGSGKVVTSSRETGWNWNAVQGALLTIQEMGVGVIHAAGDTDFEDCIIRLAKRDRQHATKLLPPKPAEVLGPQIAMIAAMPGIGVDRAMKIMEWAGGNLGHAIMGLTDLETDAPVGIAIRKRVRSLLGLRDKEMVHLMMDKDDNEVLQVVKENSDGK